MKKLMGLFFVLLFSMVFSLSPSDLIWNGFVQVNFDKPQFDLNEEITGSIYLNNAEDFPLIDGRIVLQIVQGTYEYPSQFSNDNIVNETKISDIWVLPNSMKQIDFVLPAQKSGNYRLDVYSWVLKSKFVGSSSILYNPISANFSVKGNEEKRVIINRAKTVFGPNNIVGPVGFPINAGSNFSGKVVVKNESGKAQSDLELVVSLCDWAIVFCDTPTENKFVVPFLAIGEEKTIDVSLVAPELSSAYEINLVLKKGNDIESIYKSRVIVSGPTTEARKVFITGLDTKEYNISVVISGSPDHFSAPSFDNFSLGVELFEDETKKEEKYINIDSIAFGQIMSKNFSLSSKSFDKVCIVAKKSGKEYEKECFNVDLKSIEESYEAELAFPVNVVWDYSEEISSLKIVLTKALINAKIKVLDGEDIIFEEELKDKLSKTESYLPVDKKNLILVVDDLDVKKQQVFDIRLDKTTDLSEIVSPVTIDEEGNFIDTHCYSNICEEGFVCSGTSFKTAQGDCCNANCIPVFEKQIEEIIPFVVILSILIALIALVVVVSTYNRVRK